MHNLKILVAGSFKYDFYDEACASALERLGCDVVRFAWQKYYGKGLSSKVQQRWLAGPGIWRLNRDLFRIAEETKPEIVFITRGVPLWPGTLIRIKERTGALIISNNNDDPFGADTGKRLWKHFVDAIPFYDLHFVFREVNIKEYVARGAKKVKVLLPYYVPDLHYPIALTDAELQKYECDIAFVGHAKDDVRMNYLEVLAKEGYTLRIYGWHWERMYSKYNWLRAVHFPPVWDKDYTSAIRAAKIALVFFTRGNRDTYTSRSFEITAIGTCMLSERTADIKQLFREDIEAVYFSSPRELIEKANWLLNRKDIRDKIAAAGLARLKEIGGSVNDRMKEVLDAMKS